MQVLSSYLIGPKFPRNPHQSFRVVFVAGISNFPWKNRGGGVQQMVWGGQVGICQHFIQPQHEKKLFPIDLHQKPVIFVTLLLLRPNS